MTVFEYTKALASLMAWREERSNGLIGCQAVLNVLNNRTKHSGFSNDLYENLIKPNQFSSMTIRGDSQTVVYPDAKDPFFIQILQYADVVFGDFHVDRLTHGAVYYADIGSSGFEKQGWFARNILAYPDKFPRTAQIGTTTFFGQK